MAIGIKPGPTLGKILNELYELQLAGKLKTREEAAEHLREILRRIKIQVMGQVKYRFLVLRQPRACIV